jgi:membrane associated rhomboid family serine protease
MNEYRPINRNFQPVIKNLIIINALCWLASMTLPRVLNVDIVELFGLHYWGSEAFKPYQLVTYMFLHDTSSFSHLLFNMFGLWMFGKDIELFWGKNRFLIFYFVTGIGAGIIQELVWHIDLSKAAEAFNMYASTKDINLLRPYLTNLTEHTYIPIGRLMELKEQILSSAVTVGASGALFGILLAFAMIFPQARMMLLFIPYPIRAPYFVAIYAVIELFCGVAQTADGVAHFAHLGGMLFGLILILFWKKSGKFYN